MILSSTRRLLALPCSVLSSETGIDFPKLMILMRLAGIPLEASYDFLPELNSAKTMPKDEVRKTAATCASGLAPIAPKS